MLYQIIKSIYPNIKDSDFILQDDGTGAYIAEWNYKKPKPTDDELLKSEPLAIAALQKEQNNVAIYDALAILDAKSIRTLREGDSTRLTTYNTQAAALRASLVK